MPTTRKIDLLLCVWVEQRQLQRISEVDSEKTLRQIALTNRSRGILRIDSIFWTIRYLVARGSTGLAVLGDRGETVVGRDEHVGRLVEIERFQRRKQTR